MYIFSPFCIHINFLLQSVMHTINRRLNQLENDLALIKFA
jgi:hypothetical protein